MTEIQKSFLRDFLIASGIEKQDAEAISRSARLDEINADIFEIIAAIKTNRRGDYSKPITIDEILEAQKALKLGKQESLF